MSEINKLDGVEIDFCDYQTGALNYIELLTNYYLLHHKTDKLNNSALKMLEFFELCNNNNFIFSYVFTSNSESLYFKFRCKDNKEYKRLFDFITDYFGNNIIYIRWQNNIAPTIIRIKRDFLKENSNAKKV